MNIPNRPVRWMLLAQCICAAAILPTFIFMLPLDFEPGFLPLDDYHTISWIIAALNVILFLRTPVIGLCLVWAEVEALLLCGRMRKASAFSAKNEKALGRIALALCAAGGVSLFFGDGIMPFLLAGLPEVSPVVQRLLTPFMLLTLALMVRAVQLLMHRAVSMQEESDLTV